MGQPAEFSANPVISIAVVCDLLPEIRMKPSMKSYLERADLCRRAAPRCLQWRNAAGATDCWCHLVPAGQRRPADETLQEQTQDLLHLGPLVRWPWSKFGDVAGP